MGHGAWVQQLFFYVRLVPLHSVKRPPSTWLHPRLCASGRAAHILHSMSRQGLSSVLDSFLEATEDDASGTGIGPEDVSAADVAASRTPLSLAASLD